MPLENEVIIFLVPDPLPPVDPDHPIGLVIVKEMTLEEFRRRYPDAPLG